VKEASLKAEEPSGEEVEVAAVFLTTAPFYPIAAPTPSDLPEQLPETGSSLPLLGGIGSISLAAAVAIRLRARKMSQTI